MKKIVLAMVAIFLVMSGYSQSFEGTLRWTVKLDITDPKAKAQLEDAKSKANDPANQAKVKEMQDKMNDPQFKAMLDANPQMKVQMEALMKTMISGDVSSMLPTAVTLKVKGTTTLAAIEGGMMDKTDFLTFGDKNETYTINHNAKTFTLMPKQDAVTSKEKPKVTKTSETATIMGHNCIKYIVETAGPEGKTMTSNTWVTNEIKGVDFKGMMKQMAKGQSMAFPDIDGTPLKTESMIPGTGMLTIEVTDVKKGSVPASAVQIPTGYTEAKFGQ
jgi:hypothetical protein